MKKFKFSLERILDYRKSIFDKEKNILMELYAEENDIEKKLEDYKKLYRFYSEQKTEMAKKGIEVFAYKQICIQIESAERKIEETTQELFAMEEKIDRQRYVVTEASKDVKAFENLKDKKQAEFNFELSKAEQERIMELVGNKAAEQVINGGVK